MTRIVAEIGLAHEGSLALAHSYVDAVAAAGAWGVKFQYREPLDGRGESWRAGIKPYASRLGGTREAYYRRTAFTHLEWQDIINHAHFGGLQVGMSIFSMAGVAGAELLSFDFWKIPLCLYDTHMTSQPFDARPIVQSVPTSDPIATGFTTEWFPEQTFLYCVPEYPCPEHLVHHPARYGAWHGYSDHTASEGVCQEAIRRAATMLEVHVVFDRRMQLPDTANSHTLDVLADLCRYAGGR